MTEPGWTITEAVGQLHPHISRRELARLLAEAKPIGVRRGGVGRRGAVYDIKDIMRAHAEWVRSKAP